MRTSRLAGFLGLVAVFLLSCSPKKADHSGMDLAEKTVPESLFLTVSEDVTQAEIPAFAERSVGPLYQALGASGAQSVGALEFICPQWDPTGGKSKLIIGIPIEREIAVSAPYAVWKAPAFHCAWMIYTGPMSTIKEAWMNFGEKVRASGAKPASGWREVYRHWVSPESDQNQTELQVGIE